MKSSATVLSSFMGDYITVGEVVYQHCLSAYCVAPAFGYHEDDSHLSILEVSVKNHLVLEVLRQAFRLVVCCLLRPDGAELYIIQMPFGRRLRHNGVLLVGQDGVLG